MCLAIVVCVVFALGSSAGAIDTLDVIGTVTDIATGGLGGFDSISFASTIAGYVVDLLGERVEASMNNRTAEIINDIFLLVDSLMLSLLDCVFAAENLVSTNGTSILTTDMLNNVYGFLYTVSSSLVAFKFIRKGFQIYILWRDGDPDSSPADMLKGVGEAVVYTVAFPFLYEKCVDIIKFLATGIMGRLGVSEDPTLFGNTSGEQVAASGLLSLIFIIVFFIMVFILWIKLMKQGFELLIMRIGFPLATQGLIDSDKALFKNYLQVFIKVALTTVVQVTLMSLAFRVIATMQILNVFAAIAIMATANGTPKLLQQFLLPQGNGGGLQKAQSVAMIARTAKMLFM